MNFMGNPSRRSGALQSLSLGNGPGLLFSVSQTSRPRLYGFGKVALPLPCGQKGREDGRNKK